MFHKVGQPALLSHKTHFGVDGGRAEVITAVDVRPSCEADNQGVGKMLDKHAAAVGRQVRELVADRGYRSEAAQRACAARGVTGILGMRTLANRHGSINRDRFTYDAGRDIFVCRNGKDLARFGENFQQRVSMYRAPRRTCANVPTEARLRTWCLGSLDYPAMGRRAMGRMDVAHAFTTRTPHDASSPGSQ